MGFSVISERITAQGIETSQVPASSVNMRVVCGFVVWTVLVGECECYREIRSQKESLGRNEARMLAGLNTSMECGQKKTAQSNNQDSHSAEKCPSVCV